jgi:hypothetical protein
MKTGKVCTTPPFACLSTDRPLIRNENISSQAENRGRIRQVGLTR